MKQITFEKHHTDILKIYFILTVTAFHVLRYVYKLPIMPSYGVVGFFIISGYGCYLSLQNKSYKDFIKSRLSYIIVPYYTALFFYSIAHFFFDFYNPNASVHKDILGVLTHLLFIHNISGYTQWSISGVLWFIAVIMQLYLLSYYFKRLVDYSVIKTLIIIIAIFIISFLVQYFFRIQNLYFFKSWHVIYIAPFLLGMCLAKYNVFLLNWLNLKLKNKFSLIIYLLITIFLTYETILSKNITTMTFIVLLSMPMFLIVCNIIGDFVSLKTLNFLGVFSFFLYLYNYSFYVFSPINLIENPLIKTTASFISIFVIAYIFYLFNKKLSKN